VPMAEVLRNLGCEAAWVVHGSDGLDELTTTGPSHVAQLKDGDITTFEVSPEDAGLPIAKPEDLKGGEAEHGDDNAGRLLRRARRLLSWQPRLLDRASQRRRAELIERHPGLATVLSFRAELKALWEGAHTSNERLLADFREWCVKAEASGIQVLQDFVAYLKSFEALVEPVQA